MLGLTSRMKAYGVSHSSQMTSKQKRRARKKINKFLKSRNTSAIKPAF